MPAYKLQFDTANLSLIQLLLPFAALPVFFLIALALFLNAKRMREPTFRPQTGAWARGAGILFMAASVILLLGGAANVIHIRQARAQGRFQVAEGCLTSFHPEGAGRGDYERISVDGVRFAYGREAGPVFNKTERWDGPIHPDSRVRLGYVKNGIVRVETIDHACPAAPDLSGRDGPLVVVAAPRR